MGIIKALFGALALATVGAVYNSSLTEEKKKKASGNLIVKVGFDNVVGIQPAKDQRTNPVLRIEFSLSVKNLSGVPVQFDNPGLLLEYKKQGAKDWIKLGVSPIAPVPGTQTARSGMVIPNGKSGEMAMQMDIKGWDGISGASDKLSEQRVTLSYDVDGKPQSQTFDIALSPKITSYVTSFKLKNGLHGAGTDLQTLIL